MEIISSLIPLFIIISIVFSIINKAKQAQNKSSNTRPSAGNTQSKNLSLQDIIRQQIQEQKNAVLGNTPQNTVQPPKPVQVVLPEVKYAKPNPIEKQKYREGDALKRGTLEGVPTEMQRHAHKVHIGGSYNEGDPLDRGTFKDSPLTEYEDKFDLDEISKASRKTKKATRAKRQALVQSGTVEFKIDKKSVVNGIIMSEILNKRGGRRALK